MKGWLGIGLAAVLLWSATGCNKETSPPEAAGTDDGKRQEQPSNQPDYSGKDSQSPPTGNGGGTGDGTSPVDSKPAAEAAAISFEGDTRLKAPATTLVSPTTQTFRIAFKEPMDRESVVRAILQSNSEMRGQENTVASEKFAFDWTSDTDLRVELRLTEDDYAEETNRIYAVQVNGAKTKQGADIREQPGYRVVVRKPDQLWRIASDGKSTDRLTSFQVPYGMRLLDDDARYLLLTRPTNYCECDAPSVPLYSVYDTAAKTVTDYPVPLYTQYVGDGAFIADRRGFMYADTGAKGVPEGKETVRIRVDGYVQGARISRDGKTVVAAVGKDARQTSDLDLVLIDLAGGKERKFAGALLGKLESNLVTDGTLPVSFYDDGKHIYTRMFDPDGKEIRYSYDWATNGIGTWNAPKEASGWSGFVASADGSYRMYANAGLFKGDEKKADIPRGMAGYPVHWLGASHTFVYKAYEEPAQNRKQHIYAHDADSGRARAIVTNVSPYSELIGASTDGKWIYAHGIHDMKPD